MFTSGRDLVNWVMKFFHLPNRADAVAICETLMERNVFKPLEDVRDAPSSTLSFLM